MDAETRTPDRREVRRMADGIEKTDRAEYMAAHGHGRKYGNRKLTAATKRRKNYRRIYRY